MTRSILLVLLLCKLNALFGQESRQFVFANYESRSGLPSNQINSIVQDKRGYIWMATLEGLVRFDGIRYKVFRNRSKNDGTFPLRAVDQIVMDHKNRLWVLGGYENIGIFDTEKFSYTPVPVRLKDTLLLKAPKGFIKGTENELFLGVASKELLRWDEQAQAFVQADDYFPMQEGWVMHGFGQIPGTPKCWAIINQKMMVYNRSNGHLSSPENNVDHEIMVDSLQRFNNFNALHFDQKNRLWLVSWIPDAPHLYCLDMNTGKFIIYGMRFNLDLRSYHEIHAFHEQSDGTMWVRGLGVLAYFNETKKRFEHIMSGTKPWEEMSYEVAHSFFEDRDKNIWIGTNNTGLFRFNPSQTIFNNVYHPNKVTGEKGNGGPLSFFMDTDTSFIVGVWGQGLYRYNRNCNSIPLNINGLAELNPVIVWDFCHDYDGVHAWFSCQPGLFKYNKKTRSGTFLHPAIFQNRTIRQVEADGLGNLWFGTQGLGLIKWDARKGKDDFEKGFYSVQQIGSGFPINKIIVDTKGLVWVATNNQGIYVLDPATDKVLLHFQKEGSGAEQLPVPGAAAMLEYNDSLMILATNSHVLYYNRNQHTSRLVFGLDDISGFIASLEKDRLGNIWMGTSTTLYRFDPFKSRLVGWDRADGIFKDDFNLSASAILPDGRLVFGVSEHIIVFDPSRLEVTAPLPEVQVTAVRVNHRDFPLDSLFHQEKVVFDHHQSAFIIDLSTLNFDDHYIIQYQLEGIDNDWVTADKNSQAIYAYLPPGTYRFYTRAIDAEMQYAQPQLQFTIQILPPFYQAWWFYSLLVLGAGGLMFWFDRERLKRKKAINQIRNDISDDLHKEVNTALQNINILSEMANIKAESDPQKAKEFIARIHSKSHQMIDTMDDMLWSIAPENDTMQKMVARMMEWIDRFNAQHPAPIEMQVDDKVSTLKLDMKMRYEAFSTFKKGMEKLTNVCPDGFRLYVAAEAGGLTYHVDCPHVPTGMALLRRDEFFQQEGVAKWSMD